jgi:hypothetical protein
MGDLPTPMNLTGADGAAAFGEAMAQMVNTDDTAFIQATQDGMYEGIIASVTDGIRISHIDDCTSLEKFRQTNQIAAAFNDYSRTQFLVMQPAFEQFSSTVADLKKDLESVTRRIRFV